MFFMPCLKKNNGTRDPMTTFANMKTNYRERITDRTVEENPKVSVHLIAQSMTFLLPSSDLKQNEETTMRAATDSIHVSGQKLRSTWESRKRKVLHTYNVLEVADLAPDLAVLLAAHLVHGGLQVALQQLERRHGVLLAVAHRHEPQPPLQELAHLAHLHQLRAPLLLQRAAIVVSDTRTHEITEDTSCVCVGSPAGCPSRLWCASRPRTSRPAPSPCKM
jgi:hypothetical protein